MTVVTAPAVRVMDWVAVIAPRAADTVPMPGVKPAVRVLVATPVVVVITVGVAGRLPRLVVRVTGKPPGTTLPSPSRTVTVMAAVEAPSATSSAGETARSSEAGSSRMLIEDRDCDSGHQLRRRAAAHQGDGGVAIGIETDL